MKKILIFSLIISFVLLTGEINGKIKAQENQYTNESLSQNSGYNLNQWYSEYLKSTKSGYYHRDRHLATLDNQTVIKTNSSSKSLIKRMDSTLNLTDETEEFETINYKPIKFKITSKEGDKIDSQYEGIIKGNNIILTSTMRGNINSHNSTIPFNGDLLFSAGVDKKYKENIGKSFEYKSIMPTLFQEVITLKVEYVDTEQTQVLNKPMELMKYKVSIIDHPGFESIDWRDTNGQLIKSTSEALDSSMFLTTDQEAKNINYNNTVDIMLDYLVIAKPGIPNPEEQTNVSYLAKLKSGNIKDVFISDNRQSIEQVDNGSEKIRISSFLPELLNKRFPFTDNKFKESLISNDYIQSDDPTIKIKAKEIVGNETNAYLAAKAIEKWVNKNIKNKNYDTGMATASEVLKTLSGDCTEHAVLFAALCRSIGIPANIVGGLVYIPLSSNEKGAFGYHMWTEVYVGDWVQLDATIAEKGAVDATHLALLKSTLDSYKDIEELNKKIMQVVGKLELDVLDYSSSTSSYIDISKEAKGSQVVIDLAEIAKNNDYNDQNINMQKINLDKFKKDSDKIIEKFNLSGVSSLDPTLESSDGYYTKGISALAEGNADKALKYFNKSADLIHKQDAQKYYSLGLKLASSNVFSLAKQMLEKVVELNDPMWSSLAQKAIENNLPKGDFNSVAEKYNLNGYSFANFSDNPPAAMLMFDKAIQISPNFDIALLNRANVEIESEEYESAIQDLSKAGNINPSNPYIYETLAKCYSNLNNTKSAIVNYQKALSLNPTDKNYASELRYKIAIIKAKQMTQSNPKNSSAFLTLGQAALNANETNVANSAFIKALSINPKLAAAHTGLGEVFLRTGKTTKAEIELKKALKINPAQKEALFNLAKIYKRRVNNNQAINYISKAIAIDPGNTNYIMELGNFYFDMGKYDKSLLQYTKVKNSMGLYKTGLVYLYKKQPQKAMGYLEQSIKMDKYNALPYIELARIYLKDNNLIIARQNIETALILNNNLADAYLIKGDLEAKEDRKALAANNYLDAYLLNRTSAEAYSKAKQMFQDLDQIKDFKYPPPKYSPTTAEKNYIIKLLYNESMHVNNLIYYFDSILANCKYGLVLINTNLDSNFYAKQALSNDLARTKQFYMNIYNNLKAPQSLKELNSVYLDYIWKQADYETKELFRMEYTAFNNKENRKDYDMDVENSNKDFATAAGNFYNLINSILNNWDPVITDELIDASGFDAQQYKNLTEKMEAVNKRTEESVEKLKNTGVEVQG